VCHDGIGNTAALIHTVLSESIEGQKNKIPNQKANKNIYWNYFS